MGTKECCRCLTTWTASRLIFAWAFEITPEGVKREKDVDRSQSITHSTGRKLDFVIIGALVLALGYFIWERQSAPDPAELAEVTNAATTGDNSPGSPDKRSIAVLPFVNMSSDQEQEWFADGLTEELLNALARAPDLLVAARTSSFKYKGSEEDIPTIAAALGVAHVLEGSVRRSRDRLRVTAQLIRANDGFHLWSQTYDRDPDDVIAIQEDVAVAIARALETAMDPDTLAEMVATGTSSVPAYEHYLESLAYSARGSQTGDSELTLKMKDALERAIAEDPQFATAHFELAWFWLGQMTSISITSELTNDTPEQRKANFKAAIGRAIAAEQDPVRRAKYRAWDAAFDVRLNDALANITEYLASRPNDKEAVAAKMDILLDLGRRDEAQIIAHQLLENIVDDEESVTGAIASLVFTGDLAGGAEAARRAIKSYPNNANILYQSHRALLWGGAIDEARELVPAIQASQLPPINHALAELRQACAEGEISVAKSAMERIKKITAENADLWTIQSNVLWIPYQMLGMYDEANAVLMPYHDADQLYQLSRWLSYPYFDPRPYPKLMKIMQRQGIERPPPVAIPFACKAPAT